MTNRLEFKQTVIEALKNYVYCLVDPRDNKIFYIGKGKGNRVFDHVKGAVQNENEENLKMTTIREIQNAGKEVLHYIIRHGIEDENDAFLVESVLIDLLTYDKFNTESVLTNIQAGHHQWNEGIKSIGDINALYDCAPLVPDENDKLILININKSYDLKERENIYEATRKYWRLDGYKARKADYVLATYRGVVRAVFKPSEWYRSVKSPGRWEFNGEEVENSPYLNKSVTNFIKPGNQNPIKYIY